MSNLIFVFTLSIILGGLYIWGFRHLSKEHWQFVGVIPTIKDSKGQWHGLNLTYYGFFIASACTLAVMVAYLLLASIEISLEQINLMLILTLAPCIPAAKLLARWVEKKAHTFSIGGAAFVGFVLTPWILMLLNHMFRQWGMAVIPIMPPLATISIAYCFGEGCGRLACISFGCCYGKPLTGFSPIVKRMLNHFCVTYEGHTKKIAYADGHPLCRVVAIQAMTVVLYSLVGVIGILLFLEGRGHLAYLLCVCVTQIWRFLSEYLRADYRGGGGISAYQKMAFFAAGYSVWVSTTIPEAAYAANIIEGLRLMWNPSIIVICQILWIGIFLYMGRSQVTGSRISFHVRKDRI